MKVLYEDCLLSCAMCDSRLLTHLSAASGKSPLIPSRLERTGEITRLASKPQLHLEVVTLDLTKSSNKCPQEHLKSNSLI